MKPIEFACFYGLFWISTSVPILGKNLLLSNNSSLSPFFFSWKNPSVDLLQSSSPDDFVTKCGCCDIDRFWGSGQTSLHLGWNIWAIWWRNVNVVLAFKACRPQSTQFGSAARPSPVYYSHRVTERYIMIHL